MKHPNLAIIGALIGLIVAPMLVWGFHVATAPTRGEGNAFRAKESGTNRIAAQERFEEMYADILAADKRIDVFATVAAATPNSSIAQTNLAGAITYCQTAVASYDAEARKYTARDFRSLDLPEHVDPVDPTTDCEAAK